MWFVHRVEGFGDWLRGFARPWEVVSFLWIPGLALGYACWFMLRSHEALQDFAIFRKAAVLVLHGRTPYVAPTPTALAHFDKFVYPPVTALFFAPFAAFPSGVARALMFFAGLAAIVGALRLLRVGDWRCYSLALVSAPAFNSLGVGALTSFLLLGVALAWRYRDNAVVAGVATAFTAVLKLFLWPIALWLVATRRWRACVLCAVAAIVLLLGGWAVIGFAGLHSYPKLVHVLEQVEGPVSYSVVALLGLKGSAETAATILLSLTGIVAVWLAARGPGGDRRALAVAVLVSLVATPLLWLHYLLLIYVPIALYRPRLSGLWFLPLILWATPTTHSHGITWRIALALGVLAVVVARTVLAGARVSPAAAVPRPAAN
jgi:Glycosyltransferase family 87